jgi:hypothetical protein
MKINYTLSIPNATLLALLGLILPLTARGGTPATAADFPSVVAFELGTADFQPGDSITIQQLRGTSPTIRTGETYYVEGTYTLASRDQADLAWYTTSSSTVPTPTDPSQIARVEKGAGTFRLVKTVRQDGYLHLSFYPVPSGGSFGEVYFGQGNGVLRQSWSRPAQAARPQANTATAASATQPVTASGPNQALYAYLGNPISAPADINPAYSKEGLTKAVETAARKAGITLKRIELDDSEYPFLVGVICKDGDYTKLTDQLRKMEGYAYNGSVGSSTHNAMNIVPYPAWPTASAERIGHRLGLRMQILCDKISRLD